MKDIIISSKQQKKELLILIFCFLFVFLLNIIGIILYKTPAKEIITQIGYVVVIAFVLYFIIAAFRLLIYLMLMLFKKTEVKRKEPK